MWSNHRDNNMRSLGQPPVASGAGAERQRHKSGTPAAQDLAHPRGGPCSPGLPKSIQKSWLPTDQHKIVVVLYEHYFVLPALPPY